MELYSNLSFVLGFQKKGAIIHECNNIYSHVRITRAVSSMTCGSCGKPMKKKAKRKTAKKAKKKSKKR